MAYSMFKRTLDQLTVIRKYHVMDAHRVMETVEEHAMIIKALRRSDVVSAVALTKLHTSNAKHYALTLESYDT